MNDYGKCGYLSDLSEEEDRKRKVQAEYFKKRALQKELADAKELDDARRN
jgi:hypothetical protein